MFAMSMFMGIRRVVIHEGWEVVLSMKNAEDRNNKIYDAVRKVLKDHEVQNISEDEEYKWIKCDIDREKKHLDIEIRAWDDCIDVKCIYPFRVQSNAIALVSLYMAMNNYDTMAYTIKLNQFDGVLLVETCIPICIEADMDQSAVWCVLNGAIEFSLDHFYRLANYSVGKYPEDDRDKYTWLLLSSFDALNGDKIDFLGMHYGSEDFKEDFFWKMNVIESFEKWVEKTKEWYDDNFPFC